MSNVAFDYTIFTPIKEAEKGFLQIQETPGRVNYQGFYGLCQEPDLNW
jgi:hypothetical protein